MKIWNSFADVWVSFVFLVVVVVVCFPANNKTTTLKFID